MRSVDDVLDYVPQLPPVGERLARRCWPGPVTLELADAQPESVVQRLPASVRDSRARDGQIRLRVPAHDLVLSVLRLLGRAAGDDRGPARADGADSVTGQDVVAGLGRDVDLVLDEGRSKFAQRSSIVRVDEAGFEVLRPGVFSEANLRRLASWMAVLVCTGNTCRSPMAEVLLRKRLADKLGLPVEQLEDRGVVVMSAGISASAGGRAADEAIGVMRELEARPVGPRKPAALGPDRAVRRPDPDDDPQPPRRDPGPLARSRAADACPLAGPRRRGRSDRRPARSVSPLCRTDRRISGRMGWRVQAADVFDAWVRLASRR